MINNHIEYLNKKKDSLSDNSLMTPELTGFYMEIFQAHEDFRNGAGELPDDLKNYIKDAHPQLSVDKFVIDDSIKDHLYKLAVRLTEIISRANNGMDFSHFTGNFLKDSDLLFAALLNQDYSSIEKKGIESRLALDEFIFLVHNIFKPLMVMLSDKYAVKPEKGSWLESICPFCGYLPDMSKIVESRENQRFLHCSICENEWEFPRLVCPACGCDDQKKHGFFEFEDNAMYRVYYCDECRHYIKSIRVPKSREDSGFDLAVEDVITGFLDASMIEKGYKRI